MSTCDEDVQRIKKKLEKMMKTEEVDVSQSVDMLSVLKGLPINLQVLQNTRIGVVVNNLRKASSSEELGTLAKNLLKSWKRLVSSTESAGGGANKNPASPNSNSLNNFDDRENSNSAKSPPPPMQHQVSNASSVNLKMEKIDMSRQSSFDSTTSQQSAAAAVTRTSPPLAKAQSVSTAALSNNNHLNAEKKSASFPSAVSNSSSKPSYSRSVSFSDTKDPMRVKSRQLIEEALIITDHTDLKSIELFDAHSIACRCEDAIFNEFKNTEAKYKNRIRSRLLNLKDPKNPKLKENVLMGLITAEKLAVMTAEEMASDELKQLRDKFTKEAINDHQMATPQPTKSSLLKCGKCKKTNCGYREMQTRSADEPMTVFAFCNDCGHRWKFG